MKRASLVIVIGALVLTGCRKDPTPTTPAATPGAEAGAELRVISPVVEYRAQETGSLEEVDPGDAVTVSPAANIVVSDGGNASLTWSGFLAGDLLSGTDVLVSLAEPAEKRAILDQAAGTARYHVAASDTPPDVQVKAGWVDAAVTVAPSDMIVSFVPGNPDTVWVVMVDGSAEVTMTGGDAESVTVAEGESAGFTQDGDMPTPMEVDIPGVEQWVIQLAAGSATSSIANAAFTCTTNRAVRLLAEPAANAAETGVAVKQDSKVRVVASDSAKGFARVQLPDAATGEPGWVAFAALVCNAPFTSAPEPEPTAAPPTATTGVIPTRAVVLVSATPLPTGTPLPTPTLAASTIEFWASEDDIDLGECTTLNWKTTNVKEVYYDGEGVVGTGSREECPGEDTDYTLKVIFLDGTSTTRTVHVDVHHPDTPVPPTSAPAPTVLPTLPPAPTTAPTAAPTPPTP